MQLADATTQQMLPADATWAGAVLLVVFGLFLAALVIGVVARMVMPERYATHRPITPDDPA